MMACLYVVLCEPGIPTIKMEKPTPVHAGAESHVSFTEIEEYVTLLADCGIPCQDSLDRFQTVEGEYQGAFKCGFVLGLPSLLCGQSSEVETHSEMQAEDKKTQM